MYLKQFTRHYHLHLLPVSNKDIQLADLVWKGRWGKNYLNAKGIGKNIFNRFYDATLIDKTKWEQKLKQLEEPPCELAALANLHLRNVEKVSGIFLNQLKPNLSSKKIFSLRIKNVCSRHLTNELRMEIDHHLEQLNTKEMRVLFLKPKRVNLITELYFGQLKLYLEKNYASEIEASAKEHNLNLTLFNEGEYINEYDFDTSSIPFAYRMEPLRRFNG